MSAALNELVTPTMNVMSIMNVSSQAEFTNLQKSFSDAGINMNNFQQLYGPTTGYIQHMMNLNSVRLSFPPPKYTGNNRVNDLKSALTALRTAVSPLQNNTAIKLPPAPPPDWKPPPGMPPRITSFSELLGRIDDIVKLLGGAASQGMSAAAQAEMNRKTASAAAAAQDEMNRKTASAVAASQRQTASAVAAESRRLTASAATAAAAESRRLTASAAAAAASQRQTASAAAAESRRLTASAATAAAAQAEMEKKTASAAAVAAEQQRISGTLSTLSSSLQAVKSTLQGGGGASAASANPIEAAVAAANTLMRTVPHSAVPSSVKTAVGNAVSQLRSLQSQQRFVASKLNTAVRAINAAAAKKGGSRKNNFTRARKGGSRRKRTRSHSRR